MHWSIYSVYLYMMYILFNNNSLNILTIIYYYYLLLLFIEFFTSIHSNEATKIEDHWLF
jgi:hypothetical protein